MASPQPGARASSGAAEPDRLAQLRTNLRRSLSSPTTKIERRKSKRKVSTSVAVNKATVRGAFGALLDVLALSPPATPAADGGSPKEAEGRRPIEPWKVILGVAALLAAALLAATYASHPSLSLLRSERAPASRLGAYTHRRAAGASYEELSEVLANLGPKHRCHEGHKRQNAELDRHIMALELMKEMNELLEGLAPRHHHHHEENATEEEEERPAGNPLDAHYHLSDLATKTKTGPDGRRECKPEDGCHFAIRNRYSEL
ncbi:hypothetical protein DFJ74DRAFT_650388 [Hyaloraphidium curvatum]|nr:hypothetical protein DFJ74DRAFT_650388 [Hyaloraphidium curvatum]